jgi:hypothetical protein
MQPWVLSESTIHSKLQAQMQPLPISSSYCADVRLNIVESQMQKMLIVHIWLSGMTLSVKLYEALTQRKRGKAAFQTQDFNFLHPIVKINFIHNIFQALPAMHLTYSTH